MMVSREKALRVLLFETPQNPYMNLALEEAIARMRAAGLVEDTLRIWRNANAVVVGYFQYAREEVRLEEAEKAGAIIVRRFTGGGAVYHDLGNYNYAISVIPEATPPNKLEYLYGFLLKGVIKALERLGLKASLENINDVVVGNRKVSGTAATTRWGSYFLHGSLLVATDLDLLSRLLVVPREKLEDKKISSVKYRVARIADLLGYTPSPKEIVEAIVEGYEELLGREAYFSQPSIEELKLAEILYERYSSREWNYERKPITAFRLVEKRVQEFIEELKKR